jgi:hypothetical protein
VRWIRFYQAGRSVGRQVGRKGNSPFQFGLLSIQIEETTLIPLLPPRTLLDRKHPEQTDPAQPFPWFTQFCGIEMSHNYYVYHILSVNLAAHCGVRSIIELGTGQGGLSAACGVLGIRFEIPAHTFDSRREFSSETGAFLERLKVSFHMADVFSHAGREQIEQIVAGQPTYLICDDGDKRREFATFAPTLPAGSLISVHDLGCEFWPEDAAPYAFEPVNPDEWFKYNCQFATWRKQ